ncbi:hypothetical protein Q5752_006895 [Cryptotrichosporon argae]
MDLDSLQDDGTLSHVLDPMLAQEGVGGSPHASDPPAPATRRRKAGATANPTADVKRKEANRLAAERSRLRQHEKQVALEMAVQALGDENARLRDEIANLEQRAAGATDDAAPAAHGAGAGHGSVPVPALAHVAAPDEPMNDDQSRTILAALMSDASGIDFGDGSVWMQGVENLIKEAEASGRLGEFAAIAATANGEDGEGETGEAGGAAADGAAGVAGGVTKEGARRATAAVSASALAVAINAEVDKLLRDELASIKAAIARVEGALAGAGHAADESASDAAAPIYADLVSLDADGLSRKLAETRAERAGLEDEARVLHEVVVRTKAANDADEQGIHALVGELHELGMDGGERERDKIAQILRATRSFVGGLLGGMSDTTGMPLLPPFASPATALRRRGRPPKRLTNDGSRPPTTPTKPAGPRTRRRAKSRLAQQVQLPSESLGNGVLAGGADADAAEGAETAEEHSAAAQEAAVQGATQAVVDAAQAAQAAQAEQDTEYILRQLEQRGDVDGLGQLDASALAALLPGPGEVEGDPENEGANGLEAGPSALADDAQASQLDPAASALATPTVTSRLKKGPPGSCDICGRTETSVWRKLTLRDEDYRVCNACGLYYTKFGVIRPHELWGDGKSLKKRRGARGSDAANDGRRKRRVKADDGVGEPVTGDLDGDGAASAAAAAALDPNLGQDDETIAHAVAHAHAHAQHGLEHLDPNLGQPLAHAHDHAGLAQDMDMGAVDVDVGRLAHDLSHGMAHGIEPLEHGIEHGIEHDIGQLDNHMDEAHMDGLEGMLGHQPDIADVGRAVENLFAQGVHGHD